MVIRRGEIWWVNLPEPTGAEPGYSQPLVIIQSDDFNRAKLNTVIGVVVTSNLRLAEMPGNVLIKSSASLLPKDSVANVTQIVTTDRRSLTEFVSMLDERYLHDIEDGIRLVLSL